MKKKILENLHFQILYRDQKKFFVKVRIQDGTHRSWSWDHVWFETVFTKRSRIFLLILLHTEMQKVIYFLGYFLEKDIYPAEQLDNEIYMRMEFESLGNCFINSFFSYKILW